MPKNVKVRVSRMKKPQIFQIFKSKSEGLSYKPEIVSKVRDKWSSKNSDNREFLKNFEKIEKNFMNRGEIFSIS